MDLAQIPSLLHEFHEKKREIESSVQEKHKRAELFNVFSILNLSYSEVRLHSAFIAELLNEKGSHGLGNKFLKAFIDKLNEYHIDTFIDITSPTKVIVEYPINGGWITDDGENGGRIDILIEAGDKALIIENKIYAEDQKNQLLRYWNYAKTRYPQKFNILYLTLDGKDPSDFSLGASVKKNDKDSLKYDTISYHDFIISWLERCIEISAEKELVRTTIRQYINNIKSLVGNMDQDNIEKLMDVLCTSTNLDTTLDILESSWSVGQRIRRTFLQKLKEYCENMGLEISGDFEGITNISKNNQWIKMWLPGHESVYFAIGWGAHTANDGASYGIYVSSDVQDKFKDIPEEKVLWNFTNKSNCPVGWDYFWGETGEQKNDRKWWDWRITTTWRDMSNGKMIDFIKEKVINDKTIKALKYLIEIAEN